ncbi:hypothetical protein MAPG_02332 [Magnaporthiopsis poae ATCC 64411]|uniref:Uncharacterized protein n=1 Tax=Magnaporthiopsis poae (strain ATCC 64411 / 73-15) TaxID=644358 RepID=A0A0C4DR31_MAGP6|nr:hypothetical protein MAPG_02332 [Magnaporthiopsis poae ATCC 64411]
MAPNRPSRPASSPKNQTTLHQTLFKSTATPRNHTAAHAPTEARVTTTSSDSDRVQTDVLLAILPEHLANIASQAKNHEYRNYRLADGVERLWLYETRGPGGKGRAAITHIAAIPSDVRRTPGTVPEDPVGIGNAEFNAGLKKSKYGYPILELYELIQPVTLDEMKTKWQLGGAPMGWRYLRPELWEDRWGAGEVGGRTEGKWSRRASGKLPQQSCRPPPTDGWSVVESLTPLQLMNGGSVEDMWVRPRAWPVDTGILHDVGPEPAGDDISLYEWLRGDLLNFAPLTLEPRRIHKDDLDRYVQYQHRRPILVSAAVPFQFPDQQESVAQGPSQRGGEAEGS